MCRSSFQGWVVIVILIVVLGAITGMCRGSCRDFSERQTMRAASAEDWRKGSHCLSNWDGNHAGLEALVWKRLSDPGSMEIHSTRIMPVDVSGNHAIIIDFSAKNAFGGRVRNEAVGKVEQATCNATLKFIR